jgi:hypothetical protein
MITSMFVMLYVWSMTPIAWTWYVLIGSAVTFLVALAVTPAFRPAPAGRQDELAPAGAGD